ncbi:hypothetical protein BGP_3744 [Beggiatoa sp. PS]|nr:hypothetical protein BGP_3744 [Beggiatoa sp. PS]
MVASKLGNQSFTRIAFTIVFLYTILFYNRFLLPKAKQLYGRDALRLSLRSDDNRLFFHFYDVWSSIDHNECREMKSNRYHPLKANNDRCNK